MMKNEFDARCKVAVTDAEYKKIEFVYTWHPSIDAINGKDQVAMLVEQFGMRIIEDMTPAAEIAKAYEEEIHVLTSKLRKLEKDYADFKRGQR